MAYIPDDLIIEDWASPVTILGTDAIAQLDEAVNDIISLDPASMVNFFNAQMAKIPTYLSVELGKIYAETAVHAGAAQASAAAALISENNAKSSETAAAGSEVAAKASEDEAFSHASFTYAKANEAGVSAAAALSSENNSKTSETNSKTSETNSKTSETNAVDAAARAEAVDAGKAVLSEIAGITAQRVVNEVAMLDTDYAALQAGAGTDPETIYNLYEV